jgi:hypothetical protein
MATNKLNVIKAFDSTWEYEASAKDDKAKAVIAYKDDFAGWASRCPKFYSEHPDLPGLQLVDLKAKREDGDQIKVNLFYEVVDWTADYPGRSAGQTPTDRFYIDPSLSDEPILTFHKAEDLTEEELNALRVYQNSDRTQADYDTAAAVLAESANGSEFFDAIASGQEAVRIPRVIWIRKRSVKNLNQIAFSKIGKIDDPPKDKDDNPETPSGYNWMYLPPIVNPSADGRTYDVEERWERSDESGWKTFFYGPA